MISQCKKELLKRLCHPKMYELIPAGDITDFYIRYPDRIKHPNSTTTQVMLEVADMGFYGSAKCSVNDNFCRKTGRELAFRRAVRQYLDYIKVSIN